MGYIKFNIEEVCHLLGIKVFPRGSNKFILCPGHLDNLGKADTKATNCVLYEYNYHCFGCGDGGDAYSLVMKSLNCDFVTARNYLYEAFGYKIDKETSKIPFQTLSPKEIDFLQLNKNAMQKIFIESKELYNSIVLKRIDELENQINSAIQKSCSKSSELSMFVYDIVNIDGEFDATVFRELKNSFLKDLQFLREIKEKVTL